MEFLESLIGDHHPCVQGEIMDNWPEPNRNYVGFHAALRDVADT
jgi:hypothetical protein